MMIDIWSVEKDATRPVLLKCDKFGYPNSTTCGEKMYYNTHFRTEAEAWEKLRSSQRLHLLYCGRRVKDAEEDLRKTQIYAADQLAIYSTMEENFEAWKEADHE